MAIRHYIPYGTTEPQDFQLRNGGANLSGTGYTVDIELARIDGAAIPTLPTVAWLSEGSGTVRVSGVGSLAEGMYRVRFKLTDVSSLVGYIPNGNDPDVWIVARRP